MAQAAPKERESSLGSKEQALFKQVCQFLCMHNSSLLCLTLCLQLHGSYSKDRFRQTP